MGGESRVAGGELKVCCREKEDSNCRKERECLLADGAESRQPASGMDSHHSTLKPP